MASLGLVATLLLAGAIVLSQAPKDPHALTEEPFMVPPLTQGDQVRYILEDRDHRELFIQILEPDRLRNETTISEAHVIDVREKTGPAWRNQTYHVSPKDGVVLAHDETRQHRTQWDGFFGLPTPTNMEATQTHKITVYDSPWTPPCGTWNPYQGHYRSLQDTPSSPCDRYQATWRAAAETQDENGRSVLFELWDESGERDRHLANIVLREDISVPLRIENLQGETWVLAEFGPGSGLHAEHDEQEAPLPTITMAPRTPWMLDDEGIDHPLPLSTAYQAALEHEDGELQAFLDNHPEAYLHQTHYGHRVWDTGEQVHQWQLTIGTNDTMIQVLVNQTSHTATGSLPQELGGLFGDLQPLVELQVSIGSPEPFPGAIPPKDLLSERLPRVVDLMTRYTALSGHTPDAYNLHISAGCNAMVLGGPGAGKTVYQQYTNNECPDVWFQLDAGRSSGTVQWIGTNGALEFDYETDFLAMDQAGAPVFRAQTTNEQGLLRMDGNPVTPSGLSGTTTTTGTGLQEVAPFVGWAAIGLGATIGIAWLAKGLLATLFTRLKRDRLLDHPLRNRIHEAIGAEPGIHFQGLARRLEIAQGTLRHHLEALERAELIKVVKGPRHKCYFLAKSADRHTLNAAPLLRSEGARRVLEAVSIHPDSSTHEIARRTGLTPSAVHLHLKRLEQAGIIDGGDEPGRKKWRVVQPHVVKWAATDVATA